jgi:hypothetical protein
MVCDPVSVSFNAPLLTLSPGGFIGREMKSIASVRKRRSLRSASRKIENAVKEKPGAILVHMGLTQTP